MTTYFSRTLFTGNGATTVFTIDWPYMATSDVYATADGVQQTVSVVGNSVTITPAVTTNASGLIIYRKTDLSIIENFQHLGSPSSGGFNSILTRLQYIGQELLDIGAAGVDAYSQAQLAQRWASLLTTTVDGVNYSSKQYALNSSTSATASAASAVTSSNQAAAASTSATNAATSATTATTQAGNASTSATASAGSATTATTQAGIATTQAGNASTSATAAATSATNASTSATNAGTSATNAATSATNAAALVASISNKGSVRVGTTAALTATYANGTSGVGATLTNSGALAALSIDIVALSIGDRVLVKNQASTFQNGIYTVTTVGSGAVAWVLTRAIDYDQSAEILEGTFTLISEGTTNSGFIYIMNVAGTITVGTTGVTFVSLSVPPASTASTTDVMTGTDSAKTVTSASLVPLWAQGANIASGSALPVAIDGNYFQVTGTTTINTLNQATAPHTGREVELYFAGALQLTNGANLILPGAANITTAAGDVATFRCEGTGATQTWRCVKYMKASGLPVVSSSSLQTITVKSASYTFVAADKGTQFQLKWVGGTKNYTLDTIANLGAGWWVDLVLDETWVAGTNANIICSGADVFTLGTNASATALTSTGAQLSSGSVVRIYNDGTNFIMLGRPVCLINFGPPTVNTSTSLSNIGFHATNMTCRYQCTTTDAGFAVSDEHLIAGGDSNYANAGIATYINADGSVGIRTGSLAPAFNNKGTGVGVVITTTKWNLIVEVYG